MLEACEPAVSVTSREPSPAGRVQTTWLWLDCEGDTGHAEEPTVTVGERPRLEPTMVSGTPPDVGPLAGVSAEMVGAS